PPVDGNPDSEETSGGLPKLRLAATAGQPICTPTAPAAEVPVGAAEGPDGAGGGGLLRSVRGARRRRDRAGRNACGRRGRGRGRGRGGSRGDRAGDRGRG